MSKPLQLFRRLQSAWLALLPQCEKFTVNELVKQFDLKAETIVFGSELEGDRLAARRSVPSAANIEDYEPRLYVSTDLERGLDYWEWEKLRAFGDAHFRYDLPVIDGPTLLEMGGAMRAVHLELEDALEKANKKQDEVSSEWRKAQEPWLHDDKRSDGPLWEAAERDERRRLEEIKRLEAEQMADAAETGDLEEIDEVEPAESAEGESAAEGEPAEEAAPEPETASPLAGVNAAIAASLSEAGVVKEKRKRNKGPAAQVEELALAQVNLGKLGQSNGVRNGTIGGGDYPEIPDSSADLAELEAM